MLKSSLRKLSTCRPSCVGAVLEGKRDQNYFKLVQVISNLHRFIVQRRRHLNRPQFGNNSQRLSFAEGRKGHTRKFSDPHNHTQRPKEELLGVIIHLSTSPKQFLTQPTIFATQRQLTPIYERSGGRGRKGCGKILKKTYLAQT
jgi:hypothetical protein